jgi:hypothetical protein
MSMVRPWEVLSEGPGAPTINTRKHRRQAPWEVLPESLRTPTINEKNGRRRALWQVLTEIRERPPSTLENIDDRPLGGC